MLRGDCFRIRSPRGARSGEQQGDRFGVVVQSDLLLGLDWSTILVTPTSRSALATPFRPEVDFGLGRTRVLAEQTNTYAIERLGEPVGRLSTEDMIALDGALRMVLGLR